ncbi:hypothetical protein CCACVL1_04654 [Corchorus capsularis]|uniref:Uncharacterized protein n=1 Tax=Corchorus capsularis TaxID=210143 RepID=A0A1R3JQV4_COCAP|nr:hypothetical protein CCACVL1_04654 [Corchorus capsularis]
MERVGKKFDKATEPLELNL